MICSSKFFGPMYLQPFCIATAMVEMKASVKLAMTGTACKVQGGRGTTFLRRISI